MDNNIEEHATLVTGPLPSSVVEGKDVVAVEPRCPKCTGPMVKCDIGYVGIYGWTLNPLREYYIIDDWGEMKPAGTSSDGTPRTRVGTITVDGDTYDVWKKTRENKPNITGADQTFDQYFSNR